MHAVNFDCVDSDVHCSLTGICAHTLDCSLLGWRDVTLFNLFNLRGFSPSCRHRPNSFYTFSDSFFVELFNDVFISGIRLLVLPLSPFQTFLLYSALPGFYSLLSISYRFVSHIIGLLFCCSFQQSFRLWRPILRSRAIYVLAFFRQIHLCQSALSRNECWPTFVDSRIFFHHFLSWHLYFWHILLSVFFGSTCFFFNFVRIFIGSPSKAKSVAFRPVFSGWSLDHAFHSLT